MRVQRPRARLGSRPDADCSGQLAELDLSLRSVLTVDLRQSCLPVSASVPTYTHVRNDQLSSRSM
jgi:hypothetical protein